MSLVPLLATSSPERAVWLSFGFYLLNLLVPIIPAVIIYRLFPDGKTRRRFPLGVGKTASAPADTVDEGDDSTSSVEGNIAGWKIKAIGAWGAYVTAFLLGFWAINSTAIPLIKAVGGASVWTIDSDLQLLDENGKEMNTAINNLIVKPPIAETWGKHATITLFSPTLDPPERLQVKVDGYSDENVDLKASLAQNGRIKLPVITLRRLPPLSTAPAPAPLPPGEGPAAIAANQ